MAVIVVTSKICVVSGNADAVAEQYRNRLGLAEKVPGCLGVQVLRHAERREEFLVYTVWVDREAYESYRRHPAFREAHQRIREIPGVVKVDASERAVDEYEVLS